VTRQNLAATWLALVGSTIAGLVGVGIFRWGWLATMTGAGVVLYAFAWIIALLDLETASERTCPPYVGGCWFGLHIVAAIPFYLWGLFTDRSTRMGTLVFLGLFGVVGIVLALVISTIRAISVLINDRRTRDRWPRN
jgi:hypothetical protein